MTRTVGDPHQSHDRVQRWLSIARPPNEVWAEIGAYGAIADWHPEYTSCELMEIGGETHRRLALRTGEFTMERLAGMGAHFYTSELVEGPMPVSDYRWTLSVVAEADGCHVFCSAHFEPEDPSADDIVAAHFEAGLEALRKRYV